MLGTPPIKTIKKPVKMRNIDKLRTSYYRFCKSYLVVLSKANKTIKVIRDVEKYLKHFIHICNQNKEIENSKYRPLNLNLYNLVQNIKNKK